MNATATAIAEFCDDLTGSRGFPDYPGAANGLQVDSEGTVRAIGAAVDASLAVFEEADRRQLDMLLVHHGLFWAPIHPLTGVNYRKVSRLIRNNIALYSSHLPLDAHPEVGNCALLADRLELGERRRFFRFEDRDIGWIGKWPTSRASLVARLQQIYPQGITRMTFGDEHPAEVAVVTGGGGDALLKMRAAGIDTLITGELSEHHFSIAQEHRLNVFACGHYATEVYGVQALAERVSNHFGISWEFIDTGNPI